MHRRVAQSELRAALADTPVVLIHGARQTGKSTLAKAFADEPPGRAYLTLDDAVVLAAAKHDPDGFIAGLRGPVVIDEVQRVPSLLRAIKASVDRDRTPGRFLLTGSANVLLLPRLAESLAGRIEIITLWPLSQGEIADAPAGFVDAIFNGAPAPAPPAPTTAAHGREPSMLDDLLDRVLRGGFPEPVARPSADRRAAWFRSYLTTILERDVRDMANIADLADLPRLLALVASRAGGLLNYSDLSRGLSMPVSTLKRYFALLEATFLVQTMPAWTTNLGLRLTKSPKVHLIDTGLACELLGADRDRFAADDRLRGAMIENFVFMEIVKQAACAAARPRILHFRTVSGREVDIVLETAAGKVVGVEVKATASPSGADLAGLSALAEAAGDRFVRGLVLYPGSQTIPFGDRFSAVPISSLWTPSSPPAPPPHLPRPRRGK